MAALLDITFRPGNCESASVTPVLMPSWRNSASGFALDPVKGKTAME